LCAQADRLEYVRCSGARQVGALTLGDIEGPQADIAAGKTAKARMGSRGGAATGGEDVGARTMSTLHAIFQHAVRFGKIDNNQAPPPLNAAFVGPVSAVVGMLLFGKA
jgi:hypothetical protein